MHTDGHARNRNRRSPALLRNARRGLTNEKGAILIEAALIFPVLLMIFLGMVEFSQAFTAKRRVQSVSSTVADLVSQEQSVTTADLTDIASVGAEIMLPFSLTGLSLTIASVGEDAQKNITLQWSCSWISFPAAPSCSATGAAYAGVPSGLLHPGDSIIVATTKYAYKPVAGEFLLGGLTFSGASYYRPRLSASVVKE